MIGLVILLVASGWFIDRHARMDAVPDFERTVAERDQLHNELASATRALAELEQQNAVFQRAEQVAKNAAMALRETLDERQSEIAELKSDLDFYQRLLGSGGERQGLAVHSLNLFPTHSAQVFRFELTLVQNLRKAQVIEGEADLRVLGTLGDKAMELGRDALQFSDDSAELNFAFKYFQQLEGRVTLPQGFAPDSIRVRLRPSGQSPIDSDYAWRLASDLAAAEDQES